MLARKRLRFTVVELQMNKYKAYLVFMYFLTLSFRGANSKKVNTHPKIPEIDLDFFRLLLTFNKIVQILS